MQQQTKSKLQYVTVIANKRQKEQMLQLLAQRGAHGVTTLSGKGSANAGILARAFGFDTEQAKVIITALLPAEQAQSLLEVLCREYEFHKPSTGIAFATSVDALAF